MTLFPIEPVVCPCDSDPPIVTKREFDALKTEVDNLELNAIEEVEFEINGIYLDIDDIKAGTYIITTRYLNSFTLTYIVTINEEDVGATAPTYVYSNVCVVETSSVYGLRVARGESMNSGTKYRFNQISFNAGGAYISGMGWVSADSCHVYRMGVTTS